MFSIFTYIMSRVTHSEPGLPMLLLNGKRGTEQMYHKKRLCLQGAFV